MKKLPLSILAVAALASPFVVTANAAPTDARTQPSAEAKGQRAEMRGVLLDARIAGMKGVLKLTPAEEKNWAPFEAAVRDGAKLHEQIQTKMRDEMTSRSATPIERLDDWSTALSQGAAEVKKVADAAKPLYDSLDERQKRDFGPLMRSLRPRPEGRMAMARARMWMRSEQQEQR